MQVNFRIICANSEVTRVEKCLQDIPAEKAQYAVCSYWKMQGCSEITCEYSDIPIESQDLLNVVRNIGGSEKLDVSQQGDCTEYAVYTTTEKITSGEACAFVVCFVNKKENNI